MAVHIWKFFWLCQFFTSHYAAVSNSNNPRFSVMLDILYQAAFLYFHTYLASYQSSSSPCPRYIWLVNITSGVKLFIHYYHFPSLSAYLIKFVGYFTIPGPYLTKETVHVFIAMIVFLSFNVLFMINFVLLKYSPQKFSFLSLLFDFVVF